MDADDDLRPLGVAEIPGGALDHGHIEVVEVDLIETHDLLAKLDIAVKGRRVGANGIDEVAIHGRVEVVLVEIRLEGGVVAPGTGVGHVELCLAAEGGRQGVLERPQRREHRGHHECDEYGGAGDER